MAADAAYPAQRRGVLAGALEVFVVMLTAAVLVGAAVGSVLYAEWLADLHPTAWAAVFGLLAGTALAFSSFPRVTSHLAGMIYGVFCIAVIGGLRPDIARIDDWRERIFLMLDKLTAWAREAAVNGASRETLPFALLMAALFWLLGYLAGWYLFRRVRIWVVLLPPGAVLFINAYYYAGARSMLPFVAAYAVAAVLLLALSHAAEREAAWRQAQVRVGGSLRPGFVAGGLLMAAVAMLAAWQVSTVMSSGMVQSWFLRLTEPYQEAMARVNRLFSTLQNPITRPADAYDSSFELGGPRTLTEEPVMDVSAPPARYYWRARSYDAYDGRTWSSSLATELDLPPNAATLPLTPYLARVPARAQFTLFRGTDAVYAPSQPIQAGVPSRAVIENERGSTVELAHLTLPVMLLPGNRYDAIGSMSAARVNDLRRAGKKYPAWVTRRYLQVPTALPRRVRDLAKKVTAGARTHFDKAVAVEQWLRTNIAYDELLVQPPAGREAADYILFETRRAYCNYYATAMVMMLRSQGIPARVVVGYAQGEAVIDPNDANSAIWRVRQRDSHAWVEVFFPGYGWVEFEPTASQPEIPRREDPEDLEEGQTPPTPTPLPPTPQPDESQATATPDPAAAPTATATPQTEGGLAPPSGSPPESANPPPTVAEAAAAAWRWLKDSGLLWLLVIPLAAAAAVGGLRLAEGFGLWGLPIVERSYGMLMRWAGWLGVPGRGRTPYERLEALRRRAPEAGSAAQRITELYVARRFGPRRNAGEASADEVQLRTMWSELRKTLLRAMFDRRRRGARP
jgi:transglutaminase-like putative cysteine protease